MKLNLAKVLVILTYAFVVFAFAAEIAQAGSDFCMHCRGL